MADPVSTSISIVALAISAATAWLTWFRRGTLKATQPTVVCFASFESSSNLIKSDGPKVFLRTLLYATSRRGVVIESMHVCLTKDEARQNFNIWVYGDDALVRGSGLYVSETGVAANHHFLLPRPADVYGFTAGNYRLDLFAKIVGRKDLLKLWSQELTVSEEQGSKLADRNCGLYFDWGPDSEAYHSTIDNRSQ